MIPNLRTQISAVAVLLLGAGALHGDALPRHFDLARSTPEAGAVVSEVSEIRMWFTQEPQDGSLSARLVNGAGDLVDVPSVQEDGADGRVFFIPLADGLPDGTYRVRWRGIGQDGHVVRGDFGFTLASGAASSFLWTH